MPQQASGLKGSPPTSVWGLISGHGGPPKVIWAVLQAPVKWVMGALILPLR